MISYKEQAEEYFESARKINKTLNKYRKQLKTDSPLNLERINSKIASYEIIYYELKGIGNKLLEKSKED